MRITPFKLERFFAKYEFKAPYLLCTSDCESMSIGELLNFEEGSLNRLNAQRLGYTEAKGNPELRDEISKLYTRIAPDETLVFSGAEEGIFVFMNAVLKEGDHVIVHYPAYQSLFEIADSIGCEATKWYTKEEENWELDLDFLKQNIKSNTRAIIINCPHNPTGYLMDKHKLDKVIEIARAHGILIFSDEVYRFLEYNKEDTLPAACDLYENAVSLGVMSKTFGLAGLRIGWIATKNKSILEDMAVFKDYTSICSSAPSEFLAILALKNKEKLIERNLNIIRKNIDILNDFFGSHGDLFNWKAPKAGSVAFPSIKADMDIENFCIDLVEKKGVLLLPGNYFDYGNRNFRVGLGRTNLSQCVDMLDKYIRQDFKKI